MVKETVCIGVCTCQRPRLLERCLLSLAAQKQVDGVNIEIVVVDNNDAPSAGPAVEAFKLRCPFPVHYRHEPRRGIPMARNRVLEEALLSSARRDRADAVKARVHRIYPEPAPFWCTLTNDGAAYDPGTDGPVEHRKRNTVATNGVIISSKLFKDFGLRFSERLALSGEEDGEFFAKASELGALMVTSSMPVLIEEAHRSRYTYLRQIQNGLSRGGAYVSQFKDKNGYLAALRRYSTVLTARAIKGTGQLIISPVFIPFSMNRFKFTAIDGGKNIFVAFGMLGGLLSLQYEYYRQIDGN
ncbi:MAG: glycosyltransferase [Rhodomicrobium sp.]